MRRGTIEHEEIFSCYPDVYVGFVDGGLWEYNRKQRNTEESELDGIFWAKYSAGVQ